jgi:hypothetical protein
MDPIIFVTTWVDYGDKPAGCIVIAAVRETAEKFSGEKKMAAWFLKNCTYMDGTMGGADNHGEAKQVSLDMEDILDDGGFWFKETVMTGNPLGDARELRKEQGLRWDMEGDEICVDIKLNYWEKVKGV